MMSEKIGRLNAIEHLMAAEELQHPFPKSSASSGEVKEAMTLLSNVGRLDMPDNYKPSA